jgi:hypothetical protein
MEIDSEAAVQVSAARALAEIGAASSPAVDSLVSLLGTDRTTGGNTGLPKMQASSNSSDMSAFIEQRY